MKKEDMICENCRFKFESEDYPLLRCAKNAPTVIPLMKVGEIVHPEVYCGVPVSRQFYCGEGEWLEMGEVHVPSSNNFSYHAQVVRKFGQWEKPKESEE